MIKLIAGLGNPGLKYSKTRHNAGFWFLEGERFQGLQWSHEPRFSGLVASSVVSGEKVYYLKPETYMNRSGQSVAQLMRYFKITPAELLVIHDELDFVPGEVRLKKNGGHAGHNGLRDIISHLSVRDFWRLRVGIGRPVAEKSVADYVLSEPSRQDKATIESAFDWVYECFDDFFKDDISVVMQRVNTKKS